MSERAQALEAAAATFLEKTWLAKGFTGCREDRAASNVEKAVCRILGASSGDHLVENLTNLVAELAGNDRGAAPPVGVSPQPGIDAVVEWQGPDGVVRQTHHRQSLSPVDPKLGGRKGGKSKSEAKAAAARANGAKGGRPRKDKS